MSRNSATWARSIPGTTRPSRATRGTTVSSGASNAALARSSLAMSLETKSTPRADRNLHGRTPPATVEMSTLPYASAVGEASPAEGSLTLRQPVQPGCQYTSTGVIRTLIRCGSVATIVHGDACAATLADAIRRPSTERRPQGHTVTASGAVVPLYLLSLASSRKWTISVFSASRPAWARWSDGR